MNIKRILVPVDFSDASYEGVKMASSIAERHGSTVDLIHVIPLISYFHESLDLLEIPLNPEKDLYPKAKDIASQKLHEAAELIPIEHRGKLYDMVGRKIFREITDLANKNHDLIVMSNKGADRVAAVRSTITEKVIQHSKVPVLSIAQSFEEESINNILVPLDRTDKSGSALIPAVELARIFNAKITLMHIIEPYTLGMEVPEAVMESEEVIFENVIKNTSLYLSDNPEFNLTITSKPGIPFEGYLNYKDPSRTDVIPFTAVVKKGLSAENEICDYGSEHADIVVMSTHGRKGFSRVLLGSTTAAVSYRLDKPLLTVRPK